MIITHNNIILKNEGIILNKITTVPPTPPPPFVNTYSLSFDGVDDYLDLGASSTVANGGQFSLSFWVKGTSQSIGAKYLFSADYYNLHTFWTIQNTELYWRTINNNYKLLSTNLLDGDWHHILIIWNPDGANSTIRCFTDGTNEVNIATDYRYGNGGIYQGGLQYIGNRGGGTFPGFNGSIDEFAVWDNDQSANISSIYNGGTPTDLSLLATPPLHWYRNGDNGSWKSPQWLIPNNENKDKVSNYSMDFDGVNDYINIADNTIIGRTQNISYSVWVNLQSTTVRQYIVGNFQSSNFGTGLALETIGGNALVFQIGDGTNDSFFNSRVSNFSTLVSPNTWAHILATWDGTDAKIYINGNLENTWSPTTPYAIIGWNSFWIARRSDSPGSNLVNGLLNECSLFNTAISISDVWDGSGKPMDVSGVLGITNYWRLGEEATFTYNTPPNGTWNIPDAVGSNPGTSVNLVADSARVGTAPSSSNNALSFNMDLIDRVEDTPPTP